MKQVFDSQAEPDPVPVSDQLTPCLPPRHSIPKGPHATVRMFSALIQRARWSAQACRFRLPPLEPPLEKEPLLPHLVLRQASLGYARDKQDRLLRHDFGALSQAAQDRPFSRRCRRVAPRLGSRLVYPHSRPGSGCPRPIQAAGRPPAALGQRPPGPTWASRKREIELYILRRPRAFGLAGGTQDEKQGQGKSATHR